MQLERLIQQSLIWRGFYFCSILLLNIVFSRQLEAAGIGWIYFLTNIFSLVVLVGSFNLDSGFTFMVSSQKIKAQSLAWFGIVFTALMALFIFGGSSFYFKYYPSSGISTPIALQYSLLYIVGIILVNLFTVLFYADNNFFIPNIVLGSINLILALGLIIAKSLGFTNNQLIHIYFSFFLLQGVFLTIAYFLFYKKAMIFSLPNKEQLYLLFKYSSISLCSNLVFFFTYRIDYWFVEMYCSTSDLGNYIQASKLGQMLLIVPQILASAVFPATANKIHQYDTASIIAILARIIIQVFVCITMLILLVGNWLFPLLFGNSFQQLYQPMLLLMPGILSLAILVLLSAFFGGKNKVYINIIGVSIGLVIVVIADSFLVKSWGIKGAAIASSIAYVANLLFCLQQFVKHSNIRFTELLHFQQSDWLWLKQMLFSNKTV